MKKLLTSILTVLAISTNAFAAQGDADSLAGLVFAVIGLFITVVFGLIALKLLALILAGLIIAVAAVINTVIIFPIVLLINKIFGKSYEYFSFTRSTVDKIDDSMNSIYEF